MGGDKFGAIADDDVVNFSQGSEEIDKSIEAEDVLGDGNEVAPLDEEGLDAVLQSEDAERTEFVQDFAQELEEQAAQIKETLDISEAENERERAREDHEGVFDPAEQKEQTENNEQNDEHDETPLFLTEVQDQESEKQTDGAVTKEKSQSEPIDLMEADDSAVEESIASDQGAAEEPLALQQLETEEEGADHVKRQDCAADVLVIDDEVNLSEQQEMMEVAESEEQEQAMIAEEKLKEEKQRPKSEGDLLLSLAKRVGELTRRRAEELSELEEGREQAFNFYAKAEALLLSAIAERASRIDLLVNDLQRDREREEADAQRAAARATEQDADMNAQSRLGPREAGSSLDSINTGSSNASGSRPRMSTLTPSSTLPAHSGPVRVTPAQRRQQSSNQDDDGDVTGDDGPVIRFPHPPKRPLRAQHDAQSGEARVAVSVMHSERPYRRFAKERSREEILANAKQFKARYLVRELEKEGSADPTSASVAERRVRESKGRLGVSLGNVGTQVRSALSPMTEMRLGSLHHDATLVWCCDSEAARLRNPEPRGERCLRVSRCPGHDV